MLAVVSSAIVIGIVFTVVVILVTSGLLQYLIQLFNFRKTKYRTALMAACILGIVNFALSLLGLLIRTYPLLLETFGIIAYIVSAYVLIKHYYQEPRKQTILVALLLTLFAFALSFITMSIITYVFNTLTIA